MTSALLVPALFFLSALFSASETALFSLRRDDREWLRRRDSRASRAVLALLSQPHSLLVAVLWGNLLVNFLLMSLCTGAVVEALTPNPWGEASTPLTVGVALIVTTVAVVVVGELTPKAVAVTMPRTVALVTGPLLYGFRNATRWMTHPLEVGTGWVLDRIERRLPPAKGALTDQELKRFVELHGAVGALEQEATEFLAEVLELGSRRVHEVMTPRVEILAHDLTEGRDALLALVRQRQLGKVLVHRGDGVDAVIGYLRTREVLREPNRPLEQLVHPLWFVPETKSLESLLREMTERQEQLAVVLDEYGGTAGMVTLEDVVEEITGDIAREDEHPLLRRGPTPGSWFAAGRFPLRELGELLGLPFEPGPTTLSGWVAHELGRLPEAGDVVWRAGVQFRVHTAERRRAREVVVVLPDPSGRVRLPAGDEPPPDELTRSGAIRAHQRLDDWVADAGPAPDDEEPQP